MKPHKSKNEANTAKLAKYILLALSVSLFVFAMVVAFTGKNNGYSPTLVAFFISLSLTVVAQVAGIKIPEIKKPKITIGLESGDREKDKKSIQDEK